VYTIENERIQTMAGMREVAKKAGVSVSTVSAVLSNSGKYVEEQSRQRVLDAVAALNYSKPVRATDPQSVAVIFPIISSSFFSNVLLGIEDIILPEGKLIIYYDTNYLFEREIKCLTNLRKSKVSGIILDTMCPPEKEKEYLKWLKEEFISNGIPVVILERKIESDDFYSIYVNNIKAAFTATKHLYQNGHSKIAHILGNEKMVNSMERKTGYLQFLHSAGLPINQDLIEQGDYSPMSGYTAMKRLLDKGIQFTALFSANDQMAIGAIKALRAYGRRVPEDVAIVGFDNLSISSLITPALTTMHVPTFQMGRTAGQILLIHSSKIPLPKRTELEANLIIRRSSELGASDEWELIGINF
jgi:LacI family transcriptional regulator/LacI family repressor for deo operon, udp, cdd, tsx, nupC, and nupG